MMRFLESCELISQERTLQPPREVKRQYQQPDQLIEALGTKFLIGGSGAWIASRRQIPPLLVL